MSAPVSDHERRKQISVRHIAQVPRGQGYITQVPRGQSYIAQVPRDQGYIAQVGT